MPWCPALLPASEPLFTPAGSVQVCGGPGCCVGGVGGDGAAPPELQARPGGAQASHGAATAPPQAQRGEKRRHSAAAHWHAGTVPALSSTLCSCNQFCLCARTLGLGHAQPPPAPSLPSPTLPARCCPQEEERALPPQERVYRSLQLWSLYADLEESLGTLESTAGVYDSILDLKLATPQIILNYALFLQVWGGGGCRGRAHTLLQARCGSCCAAQQVGRPALFTHGALRSCVWCAVPACPVCRSKSTGRTRSRCTSAGSACSGEAGGGGAAPPGLQDRGSARNTATPGCSLTPA